MSNNKLKQKLGQVFRRSSSSSSSSASPRGGPGADGGTPVARGVLSLKSPNSLEGAMSPIGGGSMHSARSKRASPGQPDELEVKTAGGAFRRVELQWKDVNYTVREGKKGEVVRKVLTNQWGKASSGEILAIMGPSGSGKTSLLNALAGRVLYSKGASLSGWVLVNGRPRDDGAFKRISAYVMQDDVLYAFLTVKETIWMSAQLHLPPSVPRAEKQRQVEAIIQELGLVKAQHTIIGNERTRGVSGGERRRVMIATELISGPSVMFLDEPTSGLDSFQAQSVVSALKALARDGRTIVTVIHQPRSSIFQLFDRLHLLSDGQTLFFGPTAEAVGHFEKCGYKCPPLWNAADFLLDLIATDYRTAEAEKETKGRVAALHREHTSTIAPCDDDESALAAGQAEAARAGQGGRWNAARLQQLYADGRLFSPGTLRELFVGGKQSSWLQQFLLLAWRSGRDALRNKETIYAKFGISALLGLLVGLMYSHVGRDQQSIYDRKGVLFFVTINQAFGLITTVCGTFPRERKIVLRERACNSFHISAYYLAKFVSELPFHLISPLVLGTIVYWLAHLRRTFAHFAVFMGIITLESIAAVAVGMAISSVSSSSEVAIVLANPISVVMLLSGGFYMSIQSLPPAARWVADLSLMKWSFQALVINEFEGTTLTCTEQDKKCFQRGEEAIADIGFAGKTVANGAAGLVVLIFVLNAIAYTILRYNKPRFQLLVPPPLAVAGLSAP